MEETKVSDEVYISLDVETDGPIPGMNSLLSLGAAKFTESGELIDVRKVNMWPLNGAVSDPKTMKWWDTQPKAWEAATCDRVQAADGLQEFVLWTGPRATAICYPASFDFMFVYWYLRRFEINSPFGFSRVVDIKNYAAGVLGLPVGAVTKRTMPKCWFKGCRKHTHDAVEDAVEQGRLYFNIWKRGAP